jgi:cysteine desulfurase/selenocysteine lyase
MMNLHRRSFLSACGAALLAPPLHESTASAAGQPASPVAAWRREFPALSQQINGQPLAYLDSAATTLRPRHVIAALARFDEADNANPSGTLHSLARRAAAHYSNARAGVARYLNAASASEIVFTKGTTEAINLVASTWGVANVSRGDDIVLTVAEHYSNLLPWRALAARTGARIVIVDVDAQGRVDPGRIHDALTARTKLLAFSHVSNVLGLVNPAEEICRIARQRNVTVLVDAAQSAPHMRLDVQALGCDFLACSGHKILGPMGTGVLWARQATLDAMPPYQLGSNMAHEVDGDTAEFEHGALKYQAGTPDVSGAVGLSAAVEVLDGIGLDHIRHHDTALVRHFRTRMHDVPGLRVLGSLDDAETRLPVFSFVLPDLQVSAIVKVLDDRGIAVRAGDMAALPLLKRFGVAQVVRASCYLYTSLEDLDRLIEALRSMTRRSPRIAADF